jgi:hypothetical protein
VRTRSTPPTIGLSPIISLPSLMLRFPGGAAPRSGH